jgi:hypothetical protein
MTQTRTKSYLPDDLEDQYDRVSAIVLDPAYSAEDRRRALVTLRRWHDQWQELAAKHQLDWRERRRLRQLLGGPITVSSGAEGNLRSLAYDDAARKERFRLIKAYGEDGYRTIQDLASRLMYVRQGIPEERAYAWAEQKYQRGDYVS